MFAMPFLWHVVLGGWAFGTGIHGHRPGHQRVHRHRQAHLRAGIGALVVLVRVVNPAYPEGMMLAILFMNMFAPLIDTSSCRATSSGGRLAMQYRSTSYIIGFAALVCLICSVFVDGAAVGLKDKQDANKVLDRRRRCSAWPASAKRRTCLASEINASTPSTSARRSWTWTRAVRRLALRSSPPLTRSRCERSQDELRRRRRRPRSSGLPVLAMAYLVDKDAGAKTDMLVLPVEGKGLWSTLYGFLASSRTWTPSPASPSTSTARRRASAVRSTTRAGRRSGRAARRELLRRQRRGGIEVIKGRQAAPAQAPHNIDGLSGATITGVARARPLLARDGFKAYIPTCGSCARRASDEQQQSSRSTTPCRCSASARPSRSPRKMETALVMSARR
jgi:hypothetical protein